MSISGKVLKCPRSTVSFILLAAALQVPVAEAANITVVVKSAPKKCGPLLVAIYDSQEVFLEQPTYRGMSEHAKGATVEFKDLPSGQYAVSAFCDNNNNGDIDRGAFGRPIEPNGISRGAKGRNAPPRFQDAAIQLGTTDIVVPLKIR